MVEGKATGRPVLPAGWMIRPYVGRDEAAVLELAAADGVPGQPRATSAMLAEALVGRSVVDGGWWAELELPRTGVVVDASGVVAGVVSFARRPGDGAGLILWLHGREDPAVVGVLVEHALAELAGCATLYAFYFSWALSLGLEGLPVRHRPATHEALERAGLAGRDSWRYMRRDLDRLPEPDAAWTQWRAAVSPSADPPGWRLEVRDGEALAAESSVGYLRSGIGVVCWVGVEPAYRGKGIGRALLGQALAVLADNGAAQAILFVDDDAPGGERDRIAANRLYDAMGFVEVDRLYSYESSR